MTTDQAGVIIVELSAVIAFLLLIFVRVSAILERMERPR